MRQAGVVIEFQFTLAGQKDLPMKMHEPDISTPHTFPVSAAALLAASGSSDQHKMQLMSVPGEIGSLSSAEHLKA